MAQLLRTRRGWENEHLAKYLLSKIAFIANPVTVSDDVGTDLICTLFEQRSRPNQNGNGHTEMLYPLSTFAIQIKTKPINDTLDTVTVEQAGVEYLASLKVPFLIGVVDQEHATLNVYSGEYMPLMFSMHGAQPRVASITLHLRDLRADDGGWPPECYVPTYDATRQRCDLVMPPVATFTANAESSTITAASVPLRELCERIHGNIASRTSNEFIFKYKPDAAGASRAIITAGPGSATHYRQNFLYRLSEAFSNIAWLLQNQTCFQGPAEHKANWIALIKGEFAIHETNYEKLKAHWIDMPFNTIVTETYESAKRAVNSTP